MNKQQLRRNIQLDIKETIDKLQNQIRFKQWEQATYTGSKLNFLITDLKNIDDLIISENMTAIRKARDYIPQ